MNVEPKAIDVSSFKSLHTEEIVLLHNMFQKHNYEIRIAGGAVRDILLQKEPADIDFASDATPDEMMAMFEAENIRMLNKNGISHGTVTVRLNDVENFEVTTLRIDTDHDGRKAKVVFTTDWGLDAARRDLTINAMFLKLQFDKDPSIGLLYDHFNGQSDLENRYIRFVGEPADRIREDYLRILRYFRFHGRLSHPERRSFHEADTLAAISENSSGLASISGERLWVELKRILTCPSSYHLICCMNDCGVLPHLGFPDKLDAVPLQRYKVALENQILAFDPLPATMLSFLLHDDSEIENLHNRLKLSNLDLAVLVQVIKHRNEETLMEENDLETAFKSFRNQLILSQDRARYKTMVEEVVKASTLSVSARETLIQRWKSLELPIFPIKGTELTAQWDVKGRAIAPVILELKRQWIDSEFMLTAEELLSDRMKQNVVRSKSSNRSRSPVR
ncbi:hypothetical protein Ciccas_014214, partial [Cichlidogyrus casuarinus]